MAVYNGTFSKVFVNGTAGTHATFTIHVKASPLGGSFTLDSNNFAPDDTPTLTGWTLTSGTTYAAGSDLFFTKDTVGSTTEPTFDDSNILLANDSTFNTAFQAGVDDAAYDGTITPTFTDGQDATTASGHVSPSGGSNPPNGGALVLNAYDGAHDLDPSGGDYTAANAGNTAQPSLDWSTVTMDDPANPGNNIPYDGSYSWSSWTPGVDSSKAQLIVSFGGPAVVGGTYNFAGQTGIGYNSAVSIANYDDPIGDPSTGSMIYNCQSSGAGQSDPSGLTDYSGLLKQVASYATLTITRNAAGSGSLAGGHATFGGEFDVNYDADITFGGWAGDGVHSLASVANFNATAVVTATTIGSGVTEPSKNFSPLQMSVASSTPDFSDGTAGTAATLTITRNAAGSKPLSGGTWTLDGSAYAWNHTPNSSTDVPQWSGDSNLGDVANSAETLTLTHYFDVPIVGPTTEPTIDYSGLTMEDSGPQPGTPVVLGEPGGDLDVQLGGSSNDYWTSGRQQ